MNDNDAALYRLMTWLSPSYPVGSFSYSHGIETAVEAKTVVDRKTLEAWIAAHLRFGAGWSDAILFRHAHAAFLAEDMSRVEDVVMTARALAPTSEIKAQLEMQGGAFVSATHEAWPCGPMAALSALDVAAPYPVAVAAACAGHGIDVEAGVTAYLAEAAANLVSAGMRLIPLGQRDGQRAIASLEIVIAELVERGRGRELDEIGTAVPAIDLASMRHETQYTRLFRS